MRREEAYFCTLPRPRGREAERSIRTAHRRRVSQIPEFFPEHPLEAQANLESCEVLVKSHDSVMIPLSIVYQRGLKLDSSNPTLLFDEREACTAPR